MNARTIRRAIERKALKESRKAETPRLLAETEPRIQANRANSLLSTGPTSNEGKAKVSLNAIKTGLTGKTVLLPSDDVVQYEVHAQRFARDWQPVGERETELVQNLANIQWRLNRIPSLEMAIYALAQIEFAEKFQGYEPQAAAALIEAQAYITYHRQLSNLSLQETRLRRQLQKDAAELCTLQKERAERESQQKKQGIAPAPLTRSASCIAALPNGFEFPCEELEFMEDGLSLDPESSLLSKAA